MANSIKKVKGGRTRHGSRNNPIRNTVNQVSDNFAAGSGYAATHGERGEGHRGGRHNPGATRGVRGQRTGGGRNR